MAVKGISQLESGVDKRRVGEDEGEPRDLKGKPVVGEGVFPEGADGDQEEPDTETPEPETDHEGEDLKDGHGVWDGEEIRREDEFGFVAEAEDAGYCEAEGTYRDEDAGALCVPGKFLGHEAVNEGGADHEGDEEACPLDGDRRKGYGGTGEVVELVSLDGRVDKRAAEGCS